MSIYDYVIIGFYFLFMLVIGWVFRKHGKSTNDYFRGGGSMTWWMVGASSFVQTFTAWTFVGLAGVIYSRGTLVAWIFFSNLFGVIICMLFTAGRFRRLRVITWIEALCQRYGKTTEQFYAYFNLLMGFVYGGSGLYILAIFMSALFGFELWITIVVVGVIVTLMAASGGVWAATASDFVQSLIVMSVIFATAILVLIHQDVGGISGFIDKVPASHFKWGFDVSWGVLILWLFLGTMNSVFNMNSLSGGAARMIVVKDEKSAVKSMYIPLIGYMVMPFLAFVPSLAAVFLFPDIGELYPQLNFPKEAGYAAVSMKVLPMGMVGLLACSMFSATMSTMDSALNRNAAIFVKNIYQRVIRPYCGEKEAMLVAKIFTLIFGVLLIFIGIQFAAFKKLPVFELGALIGSLLAQPLLIPMVLAIFIKKIPRWTAITTAVIGLLTSILTMKVIPVVELAEYYFNDLTKQDKFDISWMVPNLAVTLVCLGWFFFTMLFYKPPKPGSEAAKDVELFFRNQATPIDLKAEGVVESDGTQAKTMGYLSLAYGVFIMLGIAIPNGMTGRMVFLCVGGAILMIGLLLLYAGYKQDAKSENCPAGRSVEGETEV
jgi:solute:Na+ symporter, SSS family